MASQEAIIINKLADDLYTVVTTFANGWSQSQTATSEDDARIYARGMLDGIKAVRNMIGTGPEIVVYVKDI